MKIVNGFDLMRCAVEHQWLLPAFNTSNMEMTYGIVQGLNAARQPGYLQTSSRNFQYATPEMFVEMAREALKGTDIPVALHLDHGTSYEDVKRCVDAGFTSIMIDASKLEFEENIKAVRRAVEYCHFYGVPVEAELGAIGGKEDGEFVESDAKTDPGMVEDFARRTGCDLLAVSVGNVHGLKQVPHIDLPLLREISERSPVPLVLHGGSGIPFEIIRQAKRFRLVKINYASDLRREFIRCFGEAYEADRGACNLIELGQKATQAVCGKAAYLATEINR